MTMNPPHRSWRTVLGVLTCGVALMLPATVRPYPYNNFVAEECGTLPAEAQPSCNNLYYEASNLYKYFGWNYAGEYDKFYFSWTSVREHKAQHYKCQYTTAFTPVAVKHQTDVKGNPAPPVAKIMGEVRRHTLCHAASDSGSLVIKDTDTTTFSWLWLDGTYALTPQELYATYVADQLICASNIKYNMPWMDPVKITRSCDEDLSKPPSDSNGDLVADNGLDESGALLILGIEEE